MFHNLSKLFHSHKGQYYLSEYDSYRNRLFCKCCYKVQDNILHNQTHPHQHLQDKHILYIFRRIHRQWSTADKYSYSHHIDIQAYKHKTHIFRRIPHPLRFLWLNKSSNSGRIYKMHTSRYNCHLHQLVRQDN